MTWKGINKRCKKRNPVTHTNKIILFFLLLIINISFMSMKAFWWCSFQMEGTCYISKMQLLGGAMAPLLTSYPTIDYFNIEQNRQEISLPGQTCLRRWPLEWRWRLRRTFPAPNRSSCTPCSRRANLRETRKETVSRDTKGYRDGFCFLRRRIYLFWFFSLPEVVVIRTATRQKADARVPARASKQTMKTALRKFCLHFL